MRKLFSHMKKPCTLWTKVLIFVSGFLSVAHVGKKMASKKSAKGVLWLNLGYKCAKILSHKEKILCRGLISANFC